MKPRRDYCPKCRRKFSPRLWSRYFDRRRDKMTWYSMCEACRYENVKRWRKNNPEAISRYNASYLAKRKRKHFETVSILVREALDE
jgi:hypothetical protein